MNLHDDLINANSVNVITIVLDKKKDSIYFSKTIFNKINLKYLTLIMIRFAHVLDEFKNFWIVMDGKNLRLFGNSEEKVLHQFQKVLGFMPSITTQKLIGNVLLRGDFGHCLLICVRN